MQRHGRRARARARRLDRRRARAPLPRHRDRARPAHAAVHAARLAGGDRARHRRRRLRSRAPRTRPPTSTASSATCSRSRAPSTRARTHAGEPVDLAEIARRAAETRRAGTRCGSTSSPTGRCRSRGDPVALQRVLTNLLDNALRHARTRVELRGARGTVASRSSTTARASPPEDLPHVFEPLFRGDRARGGAPAPASAWRSRAGWSAPTAARWRPPTPPAAAPASRSTCPPPEAQSGISA